MKNNPLENYLATVDQLLTVLPSARRENERNELRQHLEEMIANRVIAGESETEATVNALQQFGDARTVGMGLRTAYFRTAWRSTPAGTLLIALLLQFASMKMMGWYVQCYLMMDKPSATTLYYGYFLLVSLLGAGIGAITAMNAPIRRALAATTLMQVLSFVLTCSGIILAGAHFQGVNMGGLSWQLPEENYHVVTVMPIQPGIALLCGWVAALCVSQLRSQKRIAWNR